MNLNLLEENRIGIQNGYLEAQLSPMFYTNPGSLHHLVRKCHNADHVIPEAYIKHLEAEELLVNGQVPNHVKRFVMEKIKFDPKDGSIQM